MTNADKCKAVSKLVDLVDKNFPRTSSHERAAMLRTAAAFYENYISAEMAKSTMETYLSQIGRDT
jgi:hypothetical protein